MHTLACVRVLSSCKSTSIELKYWFAYCISIDVRMIYTHSFTRARDSVNVNSQITHTHRSDISPENKSRGSAVSSLPLRSSPSSDISPENMPARRTDSLLLLRKSVLWGGGRKQSGTLLKPSSQRSTFVCASVQVRSRDSVCGCFPREAVRQSSSHQ